MHKTILGLVRHLPRHNIEPEIWNFSTGHTKPELSYVETLPVLQLPCRRHPASFLGGLPRSSRDAIRDRAREIHLLQFHSVFKPENVWAARAADVPYIITPNGGYNPRVLRGRNRLAKSAWFMALEQAYVRSASAVHAVSAAEVEGLANIVDRSKIITVPNAVDDECLERDVRPPHGRDLLFLGRLAIEHKGLDLLLRGFARSHTRHRAQLVIAGPDFRQGRQRCEALMRSLEISDSVSLVGPVFGERKWELIETCYAFVHTSRWEGLPFAILEALALGKPVVVTRETNLADLVTERKVGVVVEPTPDSISDGILELLAMPRDEYDAIGRRARELVRDHFTWEIAAKMMADEYRHIVASTPLQRRLPGGPSY